MTLTVRRSTAGNRYAISFEISQVTSYRFERPLLCGGGRCRSESCEGVQDPTAYSIDGRYLFIKIGGPVGWWPWALDVSHTFL